jgi:pyruvate dehydrogenase E1 component alpha subunit
MTFRFYGHVVGDDDSYMDKAQKQKAMAGDPVPRFRKKLVDERIATEDQLAEIDSDIARKIDDAIEAALAAPYPDLDELRHDVFAEEIPA